VYSYLTYNSCTYVCTLNLQTTAAHLCLLLPYIQQLHICVYSYLTNNSCTYVFTLTLQTTAAHLCVLCTSVCTFTLHNSCTRAAHLCVLLPAHLCVLLPAHIADKKRSIHTCVYSYLYVLQIEKEEQRFLLLAALLLPLRLCVVTGPKGKPCPASAVVVREAIKWRSKDVDMTVALHETVCCSHHANVCGFGGGNVCRIGHNYIYGVGAVYFSGKSPKYTVMYGVYIRFWPTLCMSGGDLGENKWV